MRINKKDIRYEFQYNQGIKWEKSYIIGLFTGLHLKLVSVNAKASQFVIKTGIQVANDLRQYIAFKA